MEIKVCVEGVQRIVCGVTETTTCQDVVIALARALGRTGRYTLRENFQGYVRSMTSVEHLLKSLEKYGQQAREVQLTLHYLGPSSVEWPNKSQVQLRRVEGERNLHRSSTGVVLHRQSLPSLDHLHPRSPHEEQKRPKRKSLMLMEEAWSWLENLGKGRKQHLTRDKAENANRQQDNLEVKPEKPVQASVVLQGGDKNRPQNKKWTQNDVTELHEIVTERKTQRNELCVTKMQDKVLDHEDLKANETLHKLIIQQQADLSALKLKIDTTDGEILNLKMQQAESMSDEEEQLDFWLNELKAEEGYEKDLQMQFQDLKEKVAECKHQLEQYKIKVQGMDLANMRHSQCQQSRPNAAVSVRTRVDRLESVPEEKTATEIPEGDSKKMAITRAESKLPYIMVTANEIRESQPSSPAELREWWSRWINAQETTLGSKEKIVHRSEVKIHLRGTKV